MCDNNDSAARVSRHRNQVVKLGSRFVGVVQRTLAADIRTHRVKYQQLCAVLFHSLANTTIAKGQIFLFLSDKDKPVTIAACGVEPRHNGVVRIVLRRLIDNGQRLALFFIGKGQIFAFGKQSGKRKH